MNTSTQYRWNLVFGPMAFGFLYYIFLLINSEYDLLKVRNRFDMSTSNLFNASGNYFTICFTVASSSAAVFLFERLYDYFFNLTSVLIRNEKFREGNNKTMF